LRPPRRPGAGGHTLKACRAQRAQTRSSKLRTIGAETRLRARHEHLASIDERSAQDGDRARAGPVAPRVAASYPVEAVVAGGPALARPTDAIRASPRRRRPSRRRAPSASGGEARRRESAAVSPAAGCAERTNRRWPPITTTRATRLSQPWQRHSEDRAAGKVEAVVPRPARARLDVGRLRPRTGLLGGRFRAGTITSCVGTGRSEGPLRPRPPGYRLARRSGHLVRAGSRTALYRPLRQRRRRPTACSQPLAKHERWHRSADA
jgi:hypothetical protein